MEESKKMIEYRTEDRIPYGDRGDYIFKVVAFFPYDRNNFSSSFLEELDRELKDANEELDAVFSSLKRNLEAKKAFRKMKTKEAIEAIDYENLDRFIYGHLPESIQRNALRRFILYPRIKDFQSFKRIRAHEVCSHKFDIVFTTLPGLGGDQDKIEKIKMACLPSWETNIIKHIATCEVCKCSVSRYAMEVVVSIGDWTLTKQLEI